MSKSSYTFLILLAAFAVVVASFCAAGLVVAVAISQRPPPKAEKLMPKPAPAVTSKKLSQAVAQPTVSASPTTPARPEVRGVVTSLGTTGFSHRTFWGVESGLGYAYVDADGVVSVCVFRTGAPRGLKAGDLILVYGDQAPSPPSGLRLFLNCDLGFE